MQLNILLIEDNIADSTWVGIQLRKSQIVSYTLHTCVYLSKALELLKNEEFSLVLLDLCLPDSKGLETLKNFVIISKLPVIVYTGIDDPSIKEEAFKTGIADFLVKGKTSAEELNASIFKALKNWMKNELKN